MRADKPSPLMLKAIPFFQELEEEALKEAAADMWIENFRRGEQLAGRRGERLERYRETAWFVFRGVVAVYTRTRRGGRKILFFRGPGELLNQNVMGEEGLLLGEAAADAIMLCAERRALAEWVRRHPPLAAALFAHYERTLWRLAHQLKNTADAWYVERKLAGKLLKLSADFGVEREDGVEIGFHLTVQQLADYVGVPRETASRACGKLSDLGLLRYGKRRFLLPDRAALESFRREV